MTEQLDPNLPIETFFRTIKECVDFVVHGRTPFTPEQVVSSAFCTIPKYGLFNEDVREWKRLPGNQKAQENFDVHFARAYHELKESMETSRTVGYANNSETAAVLNNLAQAEGSQFQKGNVGVVRKRLLNAFEIK